MFKDIFDYVAGCWQIAAEMRERRAQMIGILTGLLALPLVWLLGGKLEPTPEGLFWIAVWATVWSLLSLFAISPFFLWRRMRKEAGKFLIETNDNFVDDKVSLVDLAKIAEKEFGWNFSPPSFQALDFRDAIRQAAADGVLLMQGRANCGALPQEYAQSSRLLRDIPQDKWHVYNLSLPTDGFLTATNNFSITVERSVSGKWAPEYWDIHCLSKLTARNWLALPTTIEFRGRAAHEEELERNRQERRKSTDT